MQIKYPDLFIAERAREDLLALTKNGPRVVGTTENEVDAVDFLYNELVNISDSTSSNRKVEIDIQSVNGSYYLDFKPFGAYNAYKNVQNVIAKLYADNSSSYSVLVNAHFDSVPTSPGAVFFYY